MRNQYLDFHSGRNTLLSQCIAVANANISDLNRDKLLVISCKFVTLSQGQTKEKSSPSFIWPKCWQSMNLEHDCVSSDPNVNIKHTAAISNSQLACRR